MTCRRRCAGEAQVSMGEGVNGDTHMNKMRSIRSDYIEDALLITAVSIVFLGLYLAAAYLLVVI